MWRCQNCTTKKVKIWSTFLKTSWITHEVVRWADSKRLSYPIFKRKRVFHANAVGHHNIQNRFLMYKVCFNEPQQGETNTHNLQSRTSAEPCKRDQTAKRVPARLRVYILSEKPPRSVLIIHTGSWINEICRVPLYYKSQHNVSVSSDDWAQMKAC